VLQFATIAQLDLQALQEPRLARLVEWVSTLQM
jgi:hypothetical protein